MACRIVATTCKTAGETKIWGFDYAPFLANAWLAGKVYANGEAIRPTSPTGFQYSCGGGQSASDEPVWPTTLGGTVTDGSITWTAEAIDNTSLRATIVSSDWAASDGITVSNEQTYSSDGIQIVTALISDGDAGSDYEVTNTVTLSDSTVEESALRVRISR
jgi:hypothetical protein